MTDQTNLISRLDSHWAAHLGCTVGQLRDGGCHVVARPSEGDGNPPPWPLHKGPVAIVTTGTGWVLSVPSDMTDRAHALCNELSFAELVEEGDRLSQEWLDGGAHDNASIARTESDAAYRIMNDLVSGIPLRGWSHYVLSYADAAVRRHTPDPHVRRISEAPVDIRRQWREWPGPMCGPHIAKHSTVSDAYGYVLNGTLVSVAQIEAEPEELAWEFGVDTLPEHRGRGFATALLKTVTAYIIQQGYVPWHYTDHYNRPSRRLPQKLGYFQYGEGLFSAV